MINFHANFLHHFDLTLSFQAHWVDINFFSDHASSDQNRFPGICPTLVSMPQSFIYFGFR